MMKNLQAGQEEHTPHSILPREEASLLSSTTTGHVPQRREKVGDWGRAKEGLQVLYFGHGISSQQQKP